MPRLNNKILNNKKSMKREIMLPLIAGIVAGVLVMIFVQFNTRLNNASNALVQLQQATAQNTKAVNEIVAFINQATGANKAGAAAGGAAATTPAQ